jgi:DNA-binding NarL/FixJ family response regulator
LVLLGIHSLLSPRSDWHIAGEARNTERARSLAADLHPELLILDLAMQRGAGFEVLRSVVALSPAPQVLVLSLDDDLATIRAAVDLGAQGYMLKTDPGRYLIEAVEALLEHRPYISPTIADRLLSNYRFAATLPDGIPAFDRLTPREQEVVRGVAEGSPYRLIAAQLSISERTVETHRAAALRKLGGKSNADLVRYAIRVGLVPP